jgi:hypothetical protein
MKKTRFSEEQMVAILREADARTILLEEIPQRVVIEQVLGLHDGLPEAGSRGDTSGVELIERALVARRRSMATPTRIAKALDVAVDPQLVHHSPENLGAGVGDKGAQIRHIIAAIRFQSIEDEAGVFAQGMHGDTREASTIAI